MGHFRFQVTFGQVALGHQIKQVRCRLGTIIIRSSLPQFICSFSSGEIRHGQFRVRPSFVCHVVPDRVYYRFVASDFKFTSRVGRVVISQDNNGLGHCQVQVKFKSVAIELGYNCIVPQFISG